MNSVTDISNFETKIDSSEAKDYPSEERKSAHSGGKRQGNTEDRSDAAKKSRLTWQPLEDVNESEGELQQKSKGALLCEGRHTQRGLREVVDEKIFKLEDDKNEIHFRLVELEKLCDIMMEMEAKLVRLTDDLAILKQKKHMKDEEIDRDENFSPQSVVLSVKLGICSISSFLEQARKHIESDEFDEYNHAELKRLKGYEDCLDKQIKKIRQVKEHWISNKACAS